MSRRYAGWLIIALFGIILLGMLTPCLADGENDNPGDPEIVLPGSKTLEPTPSILSDFWMILMAMAFQLAL